MKEMKGSPLNKELYNYILEKFVQQDSLLDELVAETAAKDIPLIQVSPEQGKFLYLLCRMIKAKNALEIGTLTGYSGIHIARGLEEGGKLVTVEINPANSALAGRFFDKAGLTQKVTPVVANAADYMKELIGENKKFDFIFVDANKEDYPRYLTMAIELSHRGTIIAFDNMLRGGKITQIPADDEVELKATQITNEMMGSDRRLESLLVPIGDGFSIALVK